MKYHQRKNSGINCLQVESLCIYSHPYFTLSQYTKINILLAHTTAVPSATEPWVQSFFEAFEQHVGAIKSPELTEFVKEFTELKAEYPTAPATTITHFIYETRLDRFYHRFIDHSSKEEINLQGQGYADLEHLHAAHWRKNGHYVTPAVAFEKANEEVVELLYGVFTSWAIPVARNQGFKHWMESENGGIAMGHWLDEHSAGGHCDLHALPGHVDDEKKSQASQARYSSYEI